MRKVKGTVYVAFLLIVEGHLSTDGEVKGPGGLSINCEVKGGLSTDGKVKGERSRWTFY